MSAPRHRSTGFRVVPFLPALLALACGGGGGGVPQATVEEANKQDLANAAVEAALTGADLSELEDVGVLLPFAIGAPPSQALAGGQPAGSFGSIPDEQCSLDGRIRFTDVEENGDTVSGTIRFEECDEGDFFADGRIRFTVDVASGNATIRIRDLLFSSGGQTATIVRFDLQCTDFLSIPECAAVEPPVVGLVGFDLREYVIDLSDASIHCDGTCTVLGGRVTDPDHGRIDFDAFDVAFECPNARPSAGRIRMEGRRGTGADITFPGCSSYEVCRDLSEDEIVAQTGVGVPSVPQECDLFSWVTPAAH